MHSGILSRATQENLVRKERMKQKLPKPTEAELAILNVLWDQGPSTVRQVHDVLKAGRQTGYTTILKLLQIMFQKGLVRRDEETRTHVYHPRTTRQQTQRQLIADLRDRAFGGSAGAMALQVLSGRRVAADDLQELKRVIGELAAKTRQG